MMVRLKRWIAGALTILLVVGLLPNYANAATITSRGKCGKNVSWTLDSAGTLTVSGKGPMYNYDMGNMPDYYNWDDDSAVKKVVVKDGITYIGEWAFSWLRPKTVVLPGSVKTIGQCAFAYSGLESIKIPSGVTKIEGSAFAESALKSISLPATVKTIGEGSFYACTNLKSITIPNGVTRIEHALFANCYSLQSIILPSKLKTISNMAFYNCTSLKSITVPKSVTSIEAEAFETGTLIAGYKGTAAEKYTKQNGNKFETLTGTHKFASPQISKVVNVNGGITISWGKVAGAAKYRVFYKAGKGKWTKLTDTTSTSYTWKKVKSGTAYTFTVRCITGNGKTYTSNYNKTGRTLAYAAIPALSSVKNSKSRAITVAWKKVSGITGYQIQYTTNKTFKSGNKAVTVNKATTTSKAITGLTANKTYYVRVRSYKTVSGKNSYSAWSAVKSIKVAMPKEYELSQYLEKNVNTVAKTLGGKYIESDGYIGSIKVGNSNISVMTFKQIEDRKEMMHFQHACNDTLCWLIAAPGFNIKGVSIGDSVSNAVNQLKKYGSVKYYGNGRPEYVCTLKSNSNIIIRMHPENGKVEEILVHYKNTYWD